LQEIKKIQKMSQQSINKVIARANIAPVAAALCTKLLFFPSSRRRLYMPRV
jgi:hypothetical protein